MRVFQVEGAWSMNNVSISTRPDPRPGLGQVRLRMKASILNYRDLLVPVHGYGARMKQLPLIMLGDCLGVGVFDFEELLAALEFVSSGKHFGKICIKHQCGLPF